MCLHTQCCAGSLNPAAVPPGRPHLTLAVPPPLPPSPTPLTHAQSTRAALAPMTPWLLQHLHSLGSILAQVLGGTYTAERAPHLPPAPPRTPLPASPSSPQVPVLIPKLGRQAHHPACLPPRPIPRSLGVLLVQVLGPHDVHRGEGDRDHSQHHGDDHPRDGDVVCLLG